MQQSNRGLEHFSPALVSRKACVDLCLARTRMRVTAAAACMTGTALDQPLVCSSVKFCQAV